MILGPPPDLPVRSTLVPALAVRLATMLVGSGLSVMVYSGSDWIGVGVLFSFLMAWDPKLLIGWGLIVLLSIGQLSHHDALTWQLLVLIAGLHLLHILSLLAMELPWHGWMTPQVLAAPLRRFVLIQIPCQLFAVAAMLLLAPGTHGHRPLGSPVIAVVGFIALAVLALLLLRPQADEH